MSIITRKMKLWRFLMLATKGHHRRSDGVRQAPLLGVRDNTRPTVT